MGVSRRFVYLLLLGIVFLILSVPAGSYLIVFITYNVFCLILFIIDYNISPEPDKIMISRRGRNKLSIYEEEEISFEVYNKSRFRLKLELKDEIPDFHFEAAKKITAGFVDSAEKKIFSYKVKPGKRGSYNFGNLHVKYWGRMGLCTRTYQAELEREYKVYPNMKNVKKYRLKTYKNRFQKQGRKTLKMLGRGTSFESLREYVAGDEYKKINWKATSRLLKPIVNQYQVEKNQHVYIFIDSGRPMSYTIRGRRKLDYVVNTAVLLSDAVNQNGDQSGLLLFNTRVNNMIAPGKGPGHRKKILEKLYHLDFTKDTSNYREAFSYFNKKERRRSIIFLFTDFETEVEAENILRVLPHISRNNLVIIILIKNHTIEKIAEENYHNNKQMFEKGVALELINARKHLIKLLNRRGVLCVEYPAEKLQFETVNKYIEVKNRNYF